MRKCCHRKIFRIQFLVKIIIFKFALVYLFTNLFIDCIDNNHKWSPLKKNGLTLEALKAKIVCYSVIQNSSIIIEVNPHFFGCFKIIRPLTKLKLFLKLMIQKFQSIIDQSVSCI